MKEIYLPDLGEIRILKILIFSEKKALLLGTVKNVGKDYKDYQEDVWQYFNPQDGKAKGY